MPVIHFQRRCNCMVYLDEVIIYSRLFEKHLANLCSVFDPFRKEGLKLKPKKCYFWKLEVLVILRPCSR